MHKSTVGPRLWIFVWRATRQPRAIDRTGEVSNETLFKIHEKFRGAIYTTDYHRLKNCDIIIVTVPTPIDKYKKPNLNPFFKAKRVAIITKNFISVNSLE